LEKIWKRFENRKNISEKEAEGYIDSAFRRPARAS